MVASKTMFSGFAPIVKGKELGVRRPTFFYGNEHFFPYEQVYSVACFRAENTND